MCVCVCVKLSAVFLPNELTVTYKQHIRTILYLNSVSDCQLLTNEREYPG